MPIQPPAASSADRAPVLEQQVQERIRRAAASAQSPATRRAYDSAWRRFDDWCIRRGYRSLPAEPAVVAAYFVDAADTIDEQGQRCYAPATLSKWVAAISDRHRRHGAEAAPTQHPVVLSTLAGIRREYAAAGDRPRSPRAPLLTEDVLSIVAAARAQVLGWADAVHERRDSALLLMGFAGAFRRSELVELTGADVALHPLDGVHIHLRRSKTDQEGQGRVHALPRAEDPKRCPPCAFARWAHVVAAFDDGGRSAVIALLSGDNSCGDDHMCQSPAQREIRDSRAIFRAISQNGNLSETAMSGAAVHAAIRRRAARAGFPASAVARLGAHSLRSGFVTQAFRNGADAHAIMRQTAHRTPAMVERYAREEAPLVGNAVTSLGL
ncbi:MAG: integrase [Mycolicibacterium sp.]